MTGRLLDELLFQECVDILAAEENAAVEFEVRQAQLRHVSVKGLMRTAEIGLNLLLGHKIYFVRHGRMLSGLACFCQKKC